MPRRKDAGLKNMIASLKNMHGQDVQIGIFGAKARKSANGSKADSLAYRLQIHDKGLGNNPERETLNSSMEESLKGDEYIEKTLTHKLHTESAKTKLDKVGQRLADNEKEAITDLKSPPKKESTIINAQRTYGGGRRNNPLIQTAEMRNSVRHRIK